MKVLLNIPYSQKETAKVIAKQNHCALFYANNQWQLNGDKVPEDLKKYVIKILEGSNSERDNIEIIEPYHYVLDIPFDMRGLLSEFGGKYNGEYKTYVLVTNQLPDLLLPYKSKPYSYEEYIEKQLNEHHTSEQPIPLNEQIIPRVYQNEAYKIIKKAIQQKTGGFLLADEVGLGKTISAGLVIKEKQFEKVLVVTTLSATAHWRNTLLKMGVQKDELIIINYDRLQKLFTVDDSKYKKKAKTKKTKNKRLANSAEVEEFDLIVWDESHKMKNNTSLRSKLGAKLANAADFNLYLSATAGQNPLELSYLAPLLAKMTGQSVKSMVDFEKWCKEMDLGVSRGDFGKWIWDGSEESIEKIHHLLFKGTPQVALRRTPQDIAGYPEISRDLTPIELNSEEQQQYLLAWQEFREVLLNIQKKGSKKSVKGEENALVANLRFRQKASLLKIPYTIEYVEDLLENGHQVAISVNFKESLLQLEQILTKAKIGVSKIYGDLSPSEKEEQRMKFQRGENKVVIFTVEEAISLHQGEHNNVPRSMVIHDLRWSAISMSQIEGRTHRDGKFSQIYWLYFINTIEEDIAKIVLNKVINMKAMIGDDTKLLREIEAKLLGTQ